MKRLLGAWLALLCLALPGCGATSPQPVALLPNETATQHAPSNDSSQSTEFTVCNFADPTVPTANTEYPLPDLLSAQTGTSTDADVTRAIRSVQEILRAEGFTDQAGGAVVVDGYYGPDTAYAVQLFQQQAGITVDGTVGQETWEALGTTYCWKYH